MEHKEAYGIQINQKIIELLRPLYISIDELVYMYSKMIEEEWNVNIIPASIKKLQALNLILSNGNLSSHGERLVADCLGYIPITKNEEDRFEEIWELFPRHDGYRNFDKTRLIRYNKQKTKDDYVIALQSYSHDKLANALKAEIKFRQDSSSENLFKYMTGSHNWFVRKCYETFMNTPVEEDIKPDEYGKDIS